MALKQVYPGLFKTIFITFFGSSLHADITAVHRALEENNETLAATYYSAIKPRYAEGRFNAQWVEKVIDAIRFHIIERHPEQAIKLLSLLQRLDIKIDYMNAYSAQAMVRAQACPLAFNGDDAIIKVIRDSTLLGMINGSQSFGNSLDDKSTVADAQHSYHTVADIPYLDQIADLQIIRNRGCRLQELTTQFYSPRALKTRILTRFIHLRQTNPNIENQSFLDPFIYFLATQLGKEELRKQAIARMHKWSLSEWIDLPAEVRRILFQNLVKEIPALKSLPKQMITRINGKKQPFWIAHLTFNNGTDEEKYQLFETLANTPQLPKRALFYYYMAQLDHRHKRLQSALRNLVLAREQAEIEENQDHPIEKISQMLTELFQTFLFDARLRMAIKAVLYPGEQLQAHLNIWMQHALSGQEKAYNQIERLLKEHSAAGRQWYRAGHPLLRAIRRRNSKKIATILNRYTGENPPASGIMRKLIRSILERGIVMNDPHFRQFKSLIDLCFKAVSRVRSGGKLEDPLLRLVYRRLGSSVVESIETVTTPLIFAGSATLTQAIRFENPFKASRPLAMTRLVLEVEPNRFYDRRFRFDLSVR